jgi:putative ABC transport system permease protein
MFRYLPLVVKNSLRNRRRSALTISSVAASMCLLGILFALYQALFLAAPPAGQALRLITYHRVSLAQALPLSYEQRIRQVPGVKDISIWQWFGGTYKDARDRRNFFARFAVEPARLLAIRSEFKMPEEQRQAFIKSRTGAIASRALADKFGWKPGEKITLVGDIFPVTLDLQLAGIFDDPDNTEQLFFNHDYLRESMTGDRKDTVGAFTVLATDADAANKVGPLIDAMFENAPQPTKTESEAAFSLQFLAFLGNVKLFLIAICAAVTFTILLVSANTMAMSVRERMREVGVLKTLGYTNGSILGIILCEAGLISMIGGAVGVAIAGALVFVVRQGSGGFQQVKAMAITPWLAMSCVIFAAGIGVVSSLVPAASASRASILDSLRDTG